MSKRCITKIFLYYLLFGYAYISRIFATSMNDQSSTLYLNGCTLTATDTGLRLTKNNPTAQILSSGAQVESNGKVNYNAA